MRIAGEGLGIGNQSTVEAQICRTLQLGHHSTRYPPLATGVIPGYGQYQFDATLGGQPLSATLTSA